MTHASDLHHRRSIRLKGYDYTLSGAYFITLVTHQRACLFGEVQNGALQYSAMGWIAAEHWRLIPDHFPHVELGAYVIMPNHLHGIIILNDNCRGTIYRAPTGDRAPTIENPAPTTIEQFQKPVAGSIPTIIRTYKASVTRRIQNEIRNGWGTIYRAPTTEFPAPTIPPAPTTPTTEFPAPTIPPAPTAPTTEYPAPTEYSSPITIWQRNYYEHIIRNDDEHQRIHLYIASNPLNWLTDDENPHKIP